MRQISITAPQGSAQLIAQIAFEIGVCEVSVAEKRVLSSNGATEIKDSIEIDVGTSLAKAFLDKFTTAPFFTRENFSIAVRQPRSLISREKLTRLTRPLVEPAVDIFEELWQFSQITYGFVGRILIGAVLLGYGLLQNKLLFMIAGLLFIPLLPLVLSIGFGLWTRQWRLAAQGVFSLALAIALLLVGGVAVGVASYPPVQYSEFDSLTTGAAISLIVGVAAGLATSDDVGRREMIGLAATAQIAIIPTWFGLCFVLGFPLADGASPTGRLLGLGLNILAIVIAALATYAAIRIKPTSLDCFKRNPQAARTSSSDGSSRSNTDCGDS